VPHTTIDLRIPDFPGHEQLIHAAKPPAARRGTLAAAVACAIMIVVAETPALAQAPDPAAQAIQAFERATHDYVQTHRRLESQIGAIRLDSTVAEVNRTIQELAAAMRAERPDAKQGDFFTPPLATELRVRINNALSENGFSAADVRRSERFEAIEAGSTALRVNGTFPWVLATAMFPCVVAALPPLSPELQYRIVGDTLVLIDVHASLILDLLPHALVETTFEWAGNNSPAR